MKNLGRKLFKNCTNFEIITYAQSRGFTLTDEDCAWMEPPAWAKDDQETLSHAITDYLMATEGHA